MHEASLLKEMTLEGVVGIVEGLNPTLIRMKLEAFNQHPAKPKKAKEAKAAKDPKAAQPAAKAASAKGAPQTAPAGN